MTRQEHITLATIYGDPRWTQWRVIGVNPHIEMRECRPLIGRPAVCPEYSTIYRPMKHEWEGACRNYDYTRLKCVYCGAAAMSNAAFKIPFDVRFRCDQIMGW